MFRALDANGDIDGTVRPLPALYAIEEIRPQFAGVALAFPGNDGLPRAFLGRHDANAFIHVLDVTTDDCPVGAAKDRLDSAVVGKGIHQDHTRPPRVIHNNVALVGHLAVVLEGAAAPEDAFWEIEVQEAKHWREYVDQQIGRRPARIIPVEPPLEEAGDVEGPLGKVAEELVPVEVGARLGVGVGNLHPFPPIAAAEVAGLNVNDLADDALLISFFAWA